VDLGHKKSSNPFCREELTSLDRDLSGSTGEIIPTSHTGAPIQKYWRIREFEMTSQASALFRSYPRPRRI
jgi:hypothetical protein